MSTNYLIGAKGRRLESSIILTEILERNTPLTEVIDWQDKNHFI